MADENPMDRGFPDPSPPAEDDRKVERAVLGFLLDAHPDHFTVPEVSRTVNAGETDFRSGYAVERAIGQLVGAGLLHCSGDLIVPTGAAVYHWRLTDGGP